MQRRSSHTMALLALLGTLCLATLGHAATIDANLNIATRTLKEVSTGLDGLRPGDVSSYNRLSAKLTKSAELLQASESKAHPDFATSVATWQALQARMAAIASEWQAAQAQAQSAQPAAQPSASAPASAPPPVAQIDLDPLMSKYERANLPQLPDSPTPEQADTWAEQVLALQTTQLAADLATIDEAVAAGAASSNDGNRVRRWISDIHQGAITERINLALQSGDGIIRSAAHTAELINAIGPEDRSKAYNFATGDNGTNNRARLDDALRAGEVANVLDRRFGKTNDDRHTLLESIANARNKLDELEPVAAAFAEVLANTPRKTRPVPPDFLAPIAQEFWLNGSILAESDAKGGIWIDSNQVGDITHNGKIWVDSNERGSIEPDGEVWLDGNSMGSLEPNGEVWRGGNQVGLIQQDGTVWVNGSAAGEIVPFQGEWKRAAILYYFRDFFAQ